VQQAHKFLELPVSDKLLQPFSTENLAFKNRMVHAPTTMNMSDGRGYVAETVRLVCRGGKTKCKQVDDLNQSDNYLKSN
jgi:hypothetical protein